VLQTDLASVKQVAQHTTSVGDTRHVETALYTLERKLQTIRRFAPKASSPLTNTRLISNNSTATLNLIIKPWLT
jgi:hypothetical protein